MDEVQMGPVASFISSASTLCIPLAAVAGLRWAKYRWDQLLHASVRPALYAFP
eukprot:CAMPEP_0182822446 /NCGR_PEP_ID=MMETSP0006_2-20121128/14217_1 /TAXON_ID=97485 /ORGANISM="Prymnesium parvum, Strain Texoma1" /LENGTH=52 /DNA_ID=CAMNT_0024949289 /DNA_START=81 /DNA_END=235 /DNA_ORIENTATION=+